VYLILHSRNKEDDSDLPWPIPEGRRRKPNDHWQLKETDEGISMLNPGSRSQIVVFLEKGGGESLTQKKREEGPAIPKRSWMKVWVVLLFG